MLEGAHCELKRGVLWSFVKAMGIEWPLEEEELPPMSMLDISWFIVAVVCVRVCGDDCMTLTYGRTRMGLALQW